MSEEKFIELLELQNKVVRKVHSAVSYLEDYKEAIKDSENDIMRILVKRLTNLLKHLRILQTEQMIKRYGEILKNLTMRRKTSPF